MSAPGLPMGQPQPGQPQPGQPPQGGTGAATMHRPMMGAAAHGMAAVHTALDMLQKALPGLPMGSELHTAVLKAVTDLSRRMQGGGGDHAAQTQVLAQAARAHQQDPMAAAMQRMQQQPQPPNPPQPEGGGGQ